MIDNLELIGKMRTGDRNAENALIEQNMGLVYSIVKRFNVRGYETEDLVQIGAIGLIKAAKKFDTSFDVKFSTYAVPMIMGEIKRFLRDDGAIKISRTLKEVAMKGWRVEEILRKRLSREPTINEVSRECGISTQSLLEAYDAAMPPGSIYESVCTGGGKDIKLLDTISGENAEDEIINRVMVNGIMKMLTERERKIIILRYFRDKTQSEIAKSIGVSQVQVSRIEKKAIQKIRANMQNKVT